MGGCPLKFQGLFGPFPGGFKTWDHFHWIPGPILHISGKTQKTSLLICWKRKQDFEIQLNYEDWNLLCQAFSNVESLKKFEGKRCLENYQKISEVKNLSYLWKFSVCVCVCALLSEKMSHKKYCLKFSEVKLTFGKNVPQKNILR